MLNADVYGPKGLPRQQSSVPGPGDLSHGLGVSPFACSHHTDHVRRPPIGGPELAGLLDAEHLPVAHGLVGVGGLLRRQGGGRDRLSPPGRDEARARRTGRQHSR